MLQALLSLSGGLFMCLFVSWKLSMLAFTSIFPVIVITQTYAEWSSRLNLEVRVALGDASSVATEAFANVSSDAYKSLLGLFACARQGLNLDLGPDMLALADSYCACVLVGVAGGEEL